MKKIITISREFGAGGSTIGKKVAEALGYEFYDKSIILQAASEKNIDVLKVLKNDEEAPFLTGFTQSLFDFYSKPVNEQIFEAQKQVIRKFGEHGNCVIVGRNANQILQEFDDSLHVFVHANLWWRVEYLKNNRMQGVPEEKILKDIEKVDRKRCKYCTYYTNTEFGDSRFYDLCLNSAKLGIDRCVETIVELSR
ncbi:AAA family ATPase [uncultured Treponema sp.]|uniref:cytidylate kinase-like family protein n=1 Tax=uncultured Treponema sp. TaxID=162155 RepID=UPI0015B90190|nr:cytidylate kinase-like family protein [uncultured Treponema sp.]